MNIRKATADEVAVVGALYDAVCDKLSEGINYPLWIKGEYPTVADAARAFEEDALFVAVEEGEVISSFILRHKPEQGYDTVDWSCPSDYSRIYVIYTFCVSPRWQRRGIGQQVLRRIEDYARTEGMIALRLDVTEPNDPACALYESVGYRYVGKADLGYGFIGLDRFKLYEKLL